MCLLYRLQEVVEILMHAHRAIFLSGALAGAVRRAVVVEQVNLFVEPAQGEEHLDALIPRHGVVTIVLG